MIIPNLKDKSAGSQLHTILFQFCKQVESSPKINPPAACRYYFLIGSLIWNTYACFDNSFPFVDGFRAERLNIACRMCEEELWCYFYSRLIVCFKELKKIECPWLTIPKYDEQVTVCPEFYRSVKQYLRKRNNDGFITDKVFDYPNKGYFINIDDTIQDLSSLPDPDSWTPLAVKQPDGSYKKQSFVQPFFGQVKNWLTTEEWDQVWQIASDNFPSKEVFDQQVDNQQEISSTLTNQQKLTAEIWAAPKKSSPPTKWMIMLALVIAAKSYPLKESVALIGGICFNLLHAGVTAWAVKTKYLQKRPIQGVRQKYFNQEIMSPYIGQITNGTQWLPWQESVSFTPGFADYVSGHSAFSMACAVFFQMIFKSDIIPLCGVFVSPDYYYLWSDVFNSINLPTCIDQICMPSHCSQVNSKYPTAPVFSSFKSWNELANQAGMSRIYGGIHWENSNVGGLEIGSYISRTLFDKINWKGMNLNF
jgi:hypothetical protein